VAMVAATTPGMRGIGPKPSASFAASGELPVCTDRATRSEAVSGTERKGHIGAQIRAVPAAAQPTKLIEVVVHLGAPCPHSSEAPAAAGAEHTATAGVQGLSWKSACDRMGCCQGWVHVARMAKARSFFPSKKTSNANF
jgi:hypothetical protein